MCAGSDMHQGKWFSLSLVVTPESTDILTTLCAPWPHSQDRGLAKATKRRF